MQAYTKRDHVIPIFYSKWRENRILIKLQTQKESIVLLDIYLQQRLCCFAYLNWFVICSKAASIINSISQATRSDIFPALPVIYLVTLAEAGWDLSQVRTDKTKRGMRLLVISATTHCLSAALYQTCANDSDCFNPQICLHCTFYSEPFVRVNSWLANVCWCGLCEELFKWLLNVRKKKSAVLYAPS